MKRQERAVLEQAIERIGRAVLAGRGESYGIRNYAGKLLAYLARRDPKLLLQLKKDARPGRSVTDSVRMRVFERDGWRCRYCDVAVDAKSAHADHVVPWVRGGSDSESNLVCACKRCNLSKGARTPEEWLQ